MKFGFVLEHLENLQPIKRCKTSVSGLNVLFWCTEFAEMGSTQMHPFYSIRPKMMFGCILEHLENLRHVERCKTSVSGLNALFWCTEDAEMISHQMHPSYSFGSKMTFVCVLEQLANHRHVTRCKILCFGP
jgi:hypothetical protein